MMYEFKGTLHSKKKKVSVTLAVVTDTQRLLIYNPISF